MKKAKVKISTELDNSLSDQTLNKADYEKLLKCVGLELPKNEPPVKKQKRSEPSKNVSLFSLNQIDKSGGKNKLELNQLLENVPESHTTKKLKRKIKKVENTTKQLSAPLPKPTSERIQRKVEYKKTSEEVTKWDHIVQKNRKASHLSFPLNQEPFHIKTVDEFFKPNEKFLTPLEKEMHALLSNNKCIERPDHALTVLEEETLAAMSLEEAKARLNELRKHRSLLSYHEAKAKRQKKIKSRHYHKMLKKQRMKEDRKLAPMEEDSEELDRQRAIERASLRHRKGSKWSRNRRIAAKSNEKLKFDLEEQRRKHVQLLERQVHSDSDDDDETNDTHNEPNLDFFSALKPAKPIALPNFVKANPWLRHCDDKKETAGNSESVETEEMKFKAAVSKLSELENEEVKDSNSVENRLEEMEDTTTMQQEEGLVEDDKEQTDDDKNVMVISNVMKKHEKEETYLKEVRFDKGNIDFSHVSLTKPISRLQPKLVESDEENQKITIEEAFADDDVVAEFQAEKHEIVNKNSQNVDMDSSLPGWGSWGGSGIKKKKKKITKKIKGERRKDSNLGHVILNDKRDVYVSKHQVHTLPYPFVNKEQFEGTIARPVGSTWNTPEIFSAAIKPGVETSIGTIIPPLNSNELFTEQADKAEIKRKFQSS